MDRVLEAIDDATHPSKMGPGEALEFLEQLHTTIESKIEEIKDDMRAAGQDWGN